MKNLVFIWKKKCIYITLEKITESNQIQLFYSTKVTEKFSFYSYTPNNPDRIKTKGQNLNIKHKLRLRNVDN